MRRFSIVLLLAAWSAAWPVAEAGAATPFAGRRYHLTVLGSTLKFPIFTKEFAEGPAITPVGGKKEVWLPDEKSTLGLRLGFEDIRYNRAGLGIGLSLWYADFADATFLYDRAGGESFLATYRNPAHLFAAFDLTGLYLPWESGGRAFGFYGLLSLVADHERYDIDRFTTADNQPGFSSFETAAKRDIGLRLGFGLGARFYVSPRLSVWAEKRWFMGETFSSGGQVAAGGFIEDDRQRTLFAPVNSLGFSLGF